MAEPRGLLGFAARQLEFFQKQAVAVERGDIVAAKVACDQIKRSLPALSRLVHQNREGGIESLEASQELNRMVEEMKKLHQKAVDVLTSSFGQLAQLLQEFRKGQQLLSHYKSGREVNYKFFDICG